MRLSSETISAVKCAADIVEVVSANVVLREKGRRLWGLCPFHGEKTPSFSVDREKKAYHCYGCGAHGDAIAYLQQIEASSFTDAVLNLARRYDVAVEGISPEQEAKYREEQSHLERLRGVIDRAAKVYHKALFSAEGKPALDYLVEERRFTLTTIKEFQLGYAPPGDRLLVYLLKSGCSIEEIAEAGLIVDRQGAWGDRFRDRLMIPISDRMGRPVAFGARAMAGQKQKYLNSPETPLYHKGDSLFAVALARPSIREQKSALVVEGYFDAIALHQAGFTNTVAAQGTAFSEDNLKLLSQYGAERVVFNFDGDSAGDLAINRAIGAVERPLYAGAVDASILRLPDGYDPDSYLREFAPAQYRRLVEEAPHYFDWRLSQFALGDLSRPEDYNRVAGEMVAFLSRLTDINRRSFYLHRCAETLCRGDHSLLALHAQNLRAQLSPEDKPAPQLKPAPSPIIQEAERLAIRLYIYAPTTRFAFRAALDQGLALAYEDTQEAWRLISEVDDYLGFPNAEPDVIESIMETNVMVDILQHSAPDLSLLHDYGLPQHHPERRMGEALALLQRRAWEDKKEAALTALKSGDFSAQTALVEAINQIRSLDSQRRSTR